MILYQEFWVEYKLNNKDKEIEPKRQGRFFKWWNDVSNPPDECTHTHYFEIVCNEQDVAKCQEEILNRFVESKKDEGEVIILERGIKDEKYIKDMPLKKCIECLTPAQFIEEFGYLLQDISIGLM